MIPRDGRPSGAARGFSIPEALVALLLGAVVMQGAWRLLLAQRTAGRTLAHRAEALQTARIVHTVLHRELRGALPSRDRSAPAADSLGLRAFRGFAFLCPSGKSGDRLIAHYRGIRDPNPAKDSILVLTAEHRWVAVKLVATRSSAERCSESLDGKARAWLLARPVSSGGIGKLFERGSYHLHDRALRYRSGRGGRQPLTAPDLGEDSGLAGVEGGGVALLLRPSPSDSTPGFGDDPFVIWPRERSP